MRMLVMGASILGSLAVAPAYAATQSAAAGATNANDVSASMEVVCRQEPAPTGSRIGSRSICKTKREWAIIDAENRDALEDVSNRNRFGNQDVFGPSGTNCGFGNTGC